MSTSGFFKMSDWYDDVAPVPEPQPQQQQLSSKRLHPWEEWYDAPKKVRTCDAAASAKQPLGKWYDVAQQVAKAVLDDNKDIALQLARIHWAGDPELAGLR